MLFRVLFATAAFFGGAGILAYLLAWAAIPDEGTEHAPIDGWVAALRRRHVPLWVVVVAGLALFWLVAFSWWAPRPIVPVIVVGIVVAVALSRREMRGARATEPMPTPGPADAPTVSLDKDVPAADAAAARPTWVGDMRSWFDDAKAATRARRRRTLPVRLATLIALVVTWTVLGVVDATTGLPLTVYLWTGLGIVGLGLLVGAMLRRFPPGLIPLLVPLAVATVGLAGTHARLGDGDRPARLGRDGQHASASPSDRARSTSRTCPASALPPRIDHHGRGRPGAPDRPREGRT